MKTARRAGEHSCDCIVASMRALEIMLRTTPRTIVRRPSAPRPWNNCWTGNRSSREYHRLLRRSGPFARW